jgi:hypothetical protein
MAMGMKSSFLILLTGLNREFLDFSEKILVVDRRVDWDYFLSFGSRTKIHTLLFYPLSKVWEDFS